jgi:hypothetical protein
MAVPGLTPRSPLRMVGPVLVTVLPARTAKLVAVPRPTGATAAPAGDCAIRRADIAPMGTRAASQEYLRILCGARLLIVRIYRIFR